MPSAANAKLEKQASMEAVENTPIRQAIIVIEHKIRNLEKRKGKLESYRDLQKSGKELNNDQKEAVAKYNEVIQTLDFARELVKQFIGISALADKDAKKLARKEALQRMQQDVLKVREVLAIQDTLGQLGDDNVRSDFLSGSNGAIQLSDEDLKILDDLYPEVTPKHDGEGFAVNAHRCADHLIAIVEGKQKEMFNTTYSHIKEVIGSVQGSSYFHQVPDVDSSSEQQLTEINDDVIIDDDQLEQISIEDTPPIAVALDEQPVNTEAPAPNTVPAPAFPPPQHQTPQSQQQPPVNIAPPQGLPGGPITEVIAQVSAVVPVVVAPLPPNAAIPHLATVQAVEHAYFAQQFMQQQRPIAEVVGGGNFYFLQESELDSPDVIPPNVQNQPRASQTPPPTQNAPIPTQTFTNQNFASVTNVSIPAQPQIYAHPIPVAVNKVPEISQAHIPGFANPINPPPPIPMPPGHVVQQIPGAVPVLQPQPPPAQQQSQIQQSSQQIPQTHTPFNNQQQPLVQPQQQQTMASAVVTGQAQQKPQFPIQSQQPPSVKPFPQNQNAVRSQSPSSAPSVEAMKEDIPSSTPVVQESSDWADDTTNEWNIASTENNQSNDWASEAQDSWIGQGQGDGYNTRGGYNNRGRGRGRGNANNNYRSRNNYQNGRPATGTYYRNNDQSGGSNNYYQNQNGNSGSGYQGGNRESGGYQGGNREGGGYQGGNRESGGYQGGNREGSGYQGNFKSRGGAGGNRGSYRGGSNQDRGVARSNNRGGGLVGQGGGNSRPPRGGGTGGQFVRRENKQQQQ